jgi:hypothetical protein
MVRIIDFEALGLELADEFRWRFTGSPVRGNEASLSIEMDGATIGFRAADGELDVTTDRQKTHRRLPRWVATRLVTGFYSGADVLAMGPIPWDRSDGKTPDDAEMDNRPLELGEPEADLLKVLFPKLWPSSWPDPDVWPWVIGHPHPQYQHEEGKTPEMKAAIDALHFPWLGR